MELSREDFETATWRRLKRYLESELTRLREANDQPSLDSIRTADVRGSISTVKRLLALDKSSAGVDGEPWQRASLEE